MNFELEFDKGEGKGKKYDEKGNLISEEKYISVSIIKQKHSFYDYKYLLSEKMEKELEGIFSYENEFEKENDYKGNIAFKDELIIIKNNNENINEKENIENFGCVGQNVLGKKERINGDDGNLINETVYLNEKTKKGIIKDSNAENNKDYYKGKEYDDNGNLIFEGEFLFNERIKGKRKIYDINNNFLFEVDYDKNSLDDKKEILLQIKSSYEKEKGLKVEIGKEINFKNHSIFVGEFFNGEKMNGMEKFYNNLIIEEDENMNDLKFKENKGNKSIFLKIEIEIKNGYICKYNYYHENKILFESEYINENISKEKWYDISNGYLVFEFEYKNGELWKGKEYINNKITFEGEYKNGEKLKGRKYDFLDGNLLFEGEYKDNKIWNGKGKESIGGFLIFEGEYKDGERLKGKEYSGSLHPIMEYDGEFKNGKRNGKGKEYKGRFNLIYDGKFKDGKRNGKGKELDHKGNIIFEGEYLNGQRNGEAKEYFNSKLIFDGQYINNKRNGKGKEFDHKGNIIFEGVYKNGKRNGKGKVFDNKGKTIFEGKYLNEKKWSGKDYYYKGNIKFEQEYNKGEKSGKIIMKESYKNKIIFEGESLNGQRNGKGKEYFQNKLVFEGEYLNGKRNGFGKEYNFDGGKFEGIFKNGKKWNGIGYNKNNEIEYEITEGEGCGSVEEYFNGILIYKGEYSNCKRHGKGIEYDFLTRRIKHEGIFVYGKFLG